MASSYSILNKIRIHIFSGLKPEMWASNSDRDNGLLLRCPTLSYTNQRRETSPACTNVGSESFRKAKCNRPIRAVRTRTTLDSRIAEHRDGTLPFLFTAPTLAVYVALVVHPCTLPTSLHCRMSSTYSRCVASESYSFEKTGFSPSLIHIFHAF